MKIQRFLGTRLARMHGTGDTTAGLMGEAATLIRLDAVSETDVGVVREHNEDNYYVDPKRRFFIVADGMGGHAAGEVASQMAVDRVRSALEDAYGKLAAEVSNNTISAAAREVIVQALHNAVVAAHSDVLNRGQAEPDKAGMGTTLDVVLYVGGDAFFAHVGDSRTYLMRGNQIMQVTTDHTLTEMLVLQGKLTNEEAATHPYRNILVNAIGVSPDLAVETAHVSLAGGDRILMCSDGLHDYFPLASELLGLMQGGMDSLTDGLHQLVELAKSRGGHDNITAIVVLAQEESARNRRSTAEQLDDHDPADTLPKAVTDTSVGMGDTIAPGEGRKRPSTAEQAKVKAQGAGDTAPPNVGRSGRRERRRRTSKKPKS